MDRRKYLTIMVSLGASTIAGCSESSSGDSNDAQESDSTQNTDNQSDDTDAGDDDQDDESDDTEIPSPQIEGVSLVSSWNDFGDLDDNSIDATTAGCPLITAYQYGIQSHNGEVELTAQLRIFDSNGSRVAQEQSTDSQLTDSEGYRTWEGSTWTESEGWDRDRYTAEVIIRDEIAELSSDPVEAEFELTEPLRESEVSLVEVDAPSQISLNDPYQYEWVFRNIGNRDGGFRTRVSVSYEGSDWVQSDDIFYLSIPEGDTESLVSSEITFDQAGEYVYRIDAIGETWSVDVTES